MSYGCPYQGSKSTIAWNLINKMPQGKRFVDLFGGGGSMTEVAALSGKYEKILYNDINKITMLYVKSAVKGCYMVENGEEFVTRETFEEQKRLNPYVKYVWSFANNGLRYLYNREREKDKKIIWDFLVNCKKSDKLRIPAKYLKLFRTKDVIKRRKALIYVCKKEKNKWFSLVCPFEPLVRLERLQKKTFLDKKNVEFKTIDYCEYEYKDGDIVYCDPPYEGTEEYNNEKFNHKKFYDWVNNADFPVFFSSYTISDDRFSLIYAKAKRRKYNDSGINKTKAVECLYCNKAGKEAYENRGHIKQ